MLDTLHRPPDRSVRPVTPDLAYYEAPAPPTDRADLEWAVGQVVFVPDRGGGLCRVARVGHGASGELALVVTTPLGEELWLSVLWKATNGEVNRR